MLEELIIKYCSPTLAGIKTGSLFAYQFQDEELLKQNIRKLNSILTPKGIRVIYFRRSSFKALIYLYRPLSLEKDLTSGDAYELLRCLGYCCVSSNRCLSEFAKRICLCEQFPHEIGLFLGYPPEDVKGFIQHNASGYKCSGYWKVYGDEQNAKNIFSKYNQCTAAYLHKWSLGANIKELAISL